MWSGPRNVSTALMYSFAQRNETKVVDEPFYAHYLEKSGAQHPGRDEVLNDQPHNPLSVIKQLGELANAYTLLFLKNMAHHMIEMGSALDKLMNGFQHIFLIRDPGDMLPSFAKTIPEPTMRDTAYKRQFELFSFVKAKELPYAVLDSKRLLEDPPSMLSELCSQLDIPFDESMLSWEAGPIPEDGIWAKYWYESVHKSTGFKPYDPKTEPFPEELIPLYNRCKPFYERMLAHAI